MSGIIRTEGEEWRYLRRFTLQALRDLGMGKNKIEQIVSLFYSIT